MSGLPDAEISAVEFERELAAAVPIMVFDTRDAESIAQWPLDAGSAAVRAVSEAELAGDPRRAVAGLADGTALRLVCNAGVRSGRLQPLVAAVHPGTVSVAGGMIAWGRVLAEDEVPLPGPGTVLQFRRQARGCLSYLIASAGEAIVVDPAPEVEPYRAAAAVLGARIVEVFDTHIHADHLSGARDLAASTGARLRISVPALARGIADPQRFDPVADGDLLRIGEAELRAVALPGHTSDMTGLLADGALVAGDSLFADSVARPDLEVGDEGAFDAAVQLWQTLHDRVLALPAATVLLPCHYPGGRRQRPVAPTIGEVRAAVPELELAPDEFARTVLASMPPRPANYELIIEANLGRGGDPDDAARLEVGANNCAVTARPHAA